MLVPQLEKMLEDVDTAMQSIADEACAVALPPPAPRPGAPPPFRRQQISSPVIPESQATLKVWTSNQKRIGPVRPRYAAREAADDVPATLPNGPAAAEPVGMPQRPQHPAVGEGDLGLYKR